MFSTFTGNPRRPRTVNLSGQAGTPFANTSWNPSIVSNTTKTVSDAQAEREKRQNDRRRLKAAAEIQRIWRGHRTRTSLAAARRHTFDSIYRSSTANTSERISRALPLLLSFFSPNCCDDLSRVFAFIADANAVDFHQLPESCLHPARLQRLIGILINSLLIAFSESPPPKLPLASLPANPSATFSDAEPATDDVQGGIMSLLRFIVFLIPRQPLAVKPFARNYYRALAQLCRIRSPNQQHTKLLVEAFSAPLQIPPETAWLHLYEALALNFLAERDLSFFEDNIALLSRDIQASQLCEAIKASYATASEPPLSTAGLIWMMAHFIDLSRHWQSPVDPNTYLQALLAQLSHLSPEISTGLGTKPGADPTSNRIEGPLGGFLDSYTSRQLLSLIDPEGISHALRCFSPAEGLESNGAIQSTGVLAGYILVLLRSFPAYADEILMRLFLEQTSNDSDPLPAIKHLWRMMGQTSVFRTLKEESENPINLILRLFRSTSRSIDETTEVQEWRIILLFLELYIFILRLSDDEDFVSGMKTQIWESDSSASRLQSCSLPLDDVKAVSIFLKNTAFALIYKANEFPHPQQPSVDLTARSRLSSYLGSTDDSLAASAGPEAAATTASQYDLNSLRAIITTALRMLYERDSRLHFLPSDHWLMTGKFEQEDFINAVIAEEERQFQEDLDDGEDEDSPADGSYDAATGTWHHSFASQRLSRNARLERLKMQQIRNQRDRRLAEIGPKLEILRRIPFVVPFETRVMIFRQFVQLDRARRGIDQLVNFQSGPFSRHYARIRRGQLFEDAYEKFYPLGDRFKDPIQITFVDQFDTLEAGIDGGGVTKEFLTSVTAEAFGDGNEGGGMFTSNQQGLLFPNPTAVDSFRESMRGDGLSESDPQWLDTLTHHLRRFEFLGRIVGKCMYEGILIDLAFAGFFLLKWPSAGPKEENGYKGSVNDLRDLDEELYQGTLRLKNYPGDVSDLGLDFTVTDQVSPPDQPVKTITRKLIPHGEQTPVTNDNRLLYIAYMARHRLVVQPWLQTDAFLRGLRAIIRPSWLSMFNQSELQRLVGGDSSAIDIDDLRRNTVYSGLYELGDDKEEHPTIKLFWKVMQSLGDAQRRDVLKYVSSTPRAPLLGFSQLKPKFSIRDGGSDEERLPSTSTCVNLLKLPLYTSESTLREKLLYAVTSGAGFDLS